MRHVDHGLRWLARSAGQQAKIGSPGQQQRIGKGGPELEQFGKRARREEAAVEGGRFSAHWRRRGRLDGETGDLGHRFDDRPIAGAAAEVAGQRVVDDLELGRLTAGGEGVGRHDKARRAEAALCGVGLRHRHLHRMRSAILA